MRIINGTPKARLDELIIDIFFVIPCVGIVPISCTMWKGSVWIPIVYYKKFKFLSVQSRKNSHKPSDTHRELFIGRDIEVVSKRRCAPNRIWCHEFDIERLKCLTCLQTRFDAWLHVWYSYNFCLTYEKCMS